jgi:hypothetical protein
MGIEDWAQSPIIHTKGIQRKNEILIKIYYKDN